MKNRQTASSKAEALLIDNDLFSAPVDLEKLAARLDIYIHVEPLEDEISGMLVVKGKTRHIVVNAGQHINRQRFTIAHEIGHLMLHHKSGDQLFVDTKLAVYHRKGPATSKSYAQASESTTVQQEREANDFAASLLMPKALLGSYIHSRDLDISDEFDVSLLANVFCVSEQAMAIRLSNLKLIGF